MQKANRSRFYAGYGDNASITSSAKDVWIRFPQPSNPMTVYRARDFTADPAMTRFTYTGIGDKWFAVDSVCNIIKEAGANANRNIEVQWRVNGFPAGHARQFSMHAEDAKIISGVGELYLSPGDYIEPWIRNIENGDPFRLYNCSFRIVEDW